MKFRNALVLLAIILIAALYLTKGREAAAPVAIPVEQGGMDAPDTGQTELPSTATPASNNTPSRFMDAHRTPEAAGDALSHAEAEKAESSTPVFPYYTWQQKMEMYYAGRPAAAVRYPVGLDYHGVVQLSDNVFAIDKAEFIEQSQTQDLLSHAQFDDTQEGMVSVSEVVPGGIFDRLGMLPGDQLQTLNGISITNYAELYSAYAGANGQDQITLQIRRNHQTIDFTYFVQ